MNNLSIDINNYIHLKSLNLNNNNISILKEIRYLTKLEKLLCLLKNQINKISKEIKFLINLKELHLSKNQIIIIQQGWENLKMFLRTARVGEPKNVLAHQKKLNI